MVVKVLFWPAAATTEGAEVYGSLRRSSPTETEPNTRRIRGRLYNFSPTLLGSGKVERWKCGKVRAKRVGHTWVLKSVTEGLGHEAMHRNEIGV